MPKNQRLCRLRRQQHRFEVNPGCIVRPCNKDRDMIDRQSSEKPLEWKLAERSPLGSRWHSSMSPVSLVDSLVDSVESPFPGLTHVLWLEAISPNEVLFVVCFRTRVYWMLRLFTPTGPSEHLPQTWLRTPTQPHVRTIVSGSTKAYLLWYHFTKSYTYMYTHIQ